MLYTNSGVINGDTILLLLFSDEMILINDMGEKTEGGLL